MRPKKPKAGQLIELPRSSRMSSWLKLLCFVDPAAQSGFGWEGSILKPGASASESALRPDKRYPESPLVLECAGPHGKRGDYLYILWQLREGQFEELGRSRSRAWEWSLDLRPLAVRALASPQSDAGLVEIAAQLEMALTNEVSRLGVATMDRSSREAVFSILHDRIAERLAAAGGDVIQNG
jgi:hypothetical protein